VGYYTLLLKGFYLQLTISIPAENTDQPYDVMSVQHNYYYPQSSFTTKVSMVNSQNIRHPVEQKLETKIRMLKRNIRDLAHEISQLP
jgi:hypothetical protein